MYRSNVRILVVDDDRLLREFYARAFESMGYEAVCACDGAEAIRFLETAEQGFALVIMDLLMPIKTGWEAMEYIRENPKWGNLPVVAITGVALSDTERKRLANLCDDIILKGQFTMSRLHNLTERFIHDDNDGRATPLRATG
ncbi:MAG: response regulator [Candidatus Pacebacteria bacterium]|nr:response regulator [Candidatus Paceibacterota bacterium]